MSYSGTVMEKVSKYPELSIIDVQKIYRENFYNQPEQTFYQVVSRMARKGEIQRLSKGIYCKPKKGRFGAVISSEKDILEYYLGQDKNNGAVVGYQMYNRHGLTTQVSKTIELYSNVISQERKQLKNVSIRKAILRFDVSTVKMIELLEVLQNYSNIEDLNRECMKIFIGAHIKYYDKRILQELLERIGYKKSTLASLKNMLDFFKVDNDIVQYLRGTSTYKALRMEELSDTAQ